MDLIYSYPFESNSSLVGDVLEGRPSEIKYQNGTVVRLGRRYGGGVPVHRFIYSSILPMELAARANAETGRCCTRRRISAGPISRSAVLPFARENG